MTTRVTKGARLARPPSFPASRGFDARARVPPLTSTKSEEKERLLAVYLQRRLCERLLLLNITPQSTRLEKNRSDNLKLFLSKVKPRTPPGGTSIYGLYRYVPLWRVWFSSDLLWDRVYKSESLGLEDGIIFHLNWSIGWRFKSRRGKPGIATQKYKKKSNLFCFGWTVLVTSLIPSGKQLI